MEQSRESDEQSVQPGHVRAPYVRPELKFLGDVTKLTQGASGSKGDADGFSQPSSMRFKKDVAYLDDAARDAVVRDLLGLRLANWEYIDVEAGAPGQRHLGIIIEDNPEVAAINPNKESVDLYSYASMAVAAAQVQARELASLRAELAELRAELRALKKS